MSRIITFFLSITLTFCFIFQTQAQEEFAPIGAKWWYSRIDVNYTLPPPIIESHNYILFESIKDTIINGNSCRKIERVDGVFDFFNEYFFHQDLSKVYLYIAPLDTFVMVYDYDLEINDTYTVPIIFPEYEYVNNVCPGVIDTIPRVTATLDSLKNIEINGIDFEVQFLSDIWNSTSHSAFHWGQPIKIIKGIAPLQSFFPTFTCLLHGSAHSDLRCYENQNIGLYNTGVEARCDTVYSIFITAIANSFSEYVQISPNPTSTRLNLEVPQEISMQSIRIINSTGKEVYNIISNGQSQVELDVSQLPVGMYFLIVTDVDLNRGIKKLIISR